MKVQGLKLALSCLPFAVLILTSGCVGKPEVKMQVVMASYGYAGNRKNVKDDVAALCDGKSSCSFMVKNETFALKQPLDPSPGDDKSMIFQWKCNDDTHKSSGVEGKKAVLTCG